MHHILFYYVADDYVERRAQFREAHLKPAREAHGRGELVLAGALADPVDGAVLLVRGESSEARRRSRDTMSTIEEMQKAVKLIPARTMLMPIDPAGHELVLMRTVRDVTTTVEKAFWKFFAQ